MSIALRLLLAGSVAAPACVDSTSPCLGPPRRLVHLAVLDDVPDGAAPRPDSHGARVLDVARASACAGDEPCLVRLHAIAALQRFDDPARLAAGPANFGTRSDLARAVVRAVEQWSRERGPGEPLVLNISAGWDPSTGCLEGHVPADVDEVRAALRLAACRGVLVFAATGNQRFPGLEGGGPLCPAAWEPLPAPTAAECAAVREPADPPPAPSLVIAVSGLDPHGAPLPGARRQSLAGLVAPAHGPGRGGPGTSFASARAAGLAAAIWTRLPDAGPDLVIERLRDLGDALGRRSDFGRDGPREVKRIDRAALDRRKCPLMAAAP